MANPFDQFDIDYTKVKPQANPFDQFDPKPVTPPSAPSAQATPGAPPAPTGPSTMENIAGFLRNVNNGMTMGGWDKLVGMLPGRTIESEEAKTAAYAKRHPYWAKGGEVAGGIVPSLMASTGVGALVPALAKQTIPRIMAREAIAAPLPGIAQDVINGQTPSIPKAAVASGIGALGGGAVGALGRVVSPSVAFRASGVDVDDAAKAATTDLMRRGENTGVRLSIPEALSESAPNQAARVAGRYNSTAALPEGSIVRETFNNERAAGLNNFVDTMKRVYGGGPATGQAAEEGAKAAVKDARDLINNSAKPYYRAAESDKVMALPRTESIRMATEAAARDRIKMGEMTRTGNDSPIGIPFLDAVRQQMGDMVEGAARTGSSNIGPISRDKDILTRAMRGASPNFGQALDIETAGRSIMLEPLERGALGKVRDGRLPQTQAEAVFGVNSPEGARDSIGALRRMEASRPGSSDGLLRTRVDAAAEIPENFASRVASTPEAMDVVRQAAGPGGGNFDQAMQILRARDPATPRPFSADNSGGPVGYLWDRLRNIGSGKLAGMYHDPLNVDKLGTIGLGQAAINAGINSAAGKSEGAEKGVEGIFNMVAPELLQVDVRARDKVRRKRRGD